MSKQKQKAGTGSGKGADHSDWLVLAHELLVTSANCCSLPSALKHTTLQEPKPVPQVVAFIFFQLC